MYLWYSNINPVSQTTILFYWFHKFIQITNFHCNWLSLYLNHEGENFISSLYLTNIAWVRNQLGQGQPIPLLMRWPRLSCERAGGTASKLWWKKSYGKIINFIYKYFWLYMKCFERSRGPEMRTTANILWLQGSLGDVNWHTNIVWQQTTQLKI